MSDDLDEYPKWVEPNPSHIVTQGDHVSTPHFEFCDVDRISRKVTVLVFDEDEEKRATSERQEHLHDKEPEETEDK